MHQPKYPVNKYNPWGKKKMFLLEFNQSNKKKYDLIYEALLGSGQQSLEEDPVTFIDLLKKLRKLGKLVDEKSKVAIYEFDTDGIIELSKTEYNKLKNIIQKVKVHSWLIEDLFDIKEWLDGIKEHTSSAT